MTAQAAEVRITHPSRLIVVVEGGSGERAWHIQYGTTVNATNAIALAGPSETAYFSHWNWLRRVDVERGLVTGRWRLPGSRITAMQWKGNHIQIDVEEQYQNRSFHRTIDFDPESPQIPYWPTGSLIASGIGEIETLCCRTASIKRDQAERWLAEAENSVSHDPLSPWLQIELGHIYGALGRAEASQVLDQTPRSGPADFSELFHLSAVLDNDGRPEAAREAFERGYENYWQRGNDPRLVGAVIGRLALYPQSAVGDDLRQEIIDRIYRTGPFVEASEYAWSSYAQLLESSGKVQEAQKWRQRAEEARLNSIYPVSRRLGGLLNTAGAFVFAGLCAGFVFVFVLFLRYLPQRRMQSHTAAEHRRRRWAGFFNVEYWSPRERLSFLEIALCAWIAAGVGGGIAVVTLRAASIPLGGFMGSFAGPASIAHLESEPPTSERDLILAMAYNQDGQMAKAEALYRRLPQYSESWNNLGAILKDEGRNAEAQQAFERALQLNPRMAEARLNSGNAPPDFWTQLHQKFLPGHAMLSPPSQEHFLRAFGNGPFLSWIGKALEGPFAGLELRTRIGPRSQGPAGLATWLVLDGVLLLTALLIGVPRARKDVTQPPSRYQLILELLFPGVAPEWRWIGGLALTGWNFLIIRSLVPPSGPGSLFPFVRTIPNIQRFFGIPVDRSALQSLQTSETLYFHLAIALLFALNAALIWRARRKRA